MRRAAAEVGGPLPGLRGLELARRRAARSADRTRGGESSLRHSCRAARPPSCTATSKRPTRRGFRRASPSSIASSEAASCPARSCCSAASPASESRRCCCRWPRTSRAHVGPVLYSSGEESEHQIKLRGERLARRPLAVVSACRNVPRAHPRRDRAAEAGARHRRFDSDDFFRALSIRSGQHRPGARGGDASAVRRQRAGTCRSCWSATSRKTGISPARRRSSTSSTRCCISKASAITRIASCAPSRTGSARRASSACSR